MKKYAVIVAGGSGRRMKSEVPKQFIEIGGKPVLMHTIDTFKKFDSAIQIILVLPKSQIEYWNSLCNKFSFNTVHTVVNGGGTRFHSVSNGLRLIEEPGIVGVHDGVRPFVSQETLYNCYKTAEVYGNAVPVVDAFESVRQTDGAINRAVDRTTIKLVQTPQVFQSQILLKAYQREFVTAFTDDASVVEATGYTINLVEGNLENIKITTPFDLNIAEVILKNINNAATHTRFLSET